MADSGVAILAFMCLAEQEFVAIYASFLCLVGEVVHVSFCFITCCIIPWCGLNSIYAPHCQWVELIPIIKYIYIYISQYVVKFNKIIWTKYVYSNLLLKKLILVGAYAPTICIQIRPCSSANHHFTPLLQRCHGSLPTSLSHTQHN